MEQDVRFCELDGRRIAYAAVGEGPLLLFAGRFVSNLAEEWGDAPARSFFDDLAETYRVVRFDRIGAGLSDRELPGAPTVELDVRSLAAVHAAVGGEPAIVFAWSPCAGRPAAEYARRYPERVRKLVFFGACASRDHVPEPTRRSIVELARTNWSLAAQMLAGMFVPSGDGEQIADVSRYLRRSADAEVAAAFLELDFVYDARAAMREVTTPSLVLHRRGDRAVPIDAGRELAALLPNARFVSLSGDSHSLHLGDQRELRRALAGFLDEATAPGADVVSPLTRRETEVLRLIAAGLSNREIGAALVLSEHTVHRHVANLLRKLGQSRRAAAAAQATRDGII
jgi:pimeloyl-ACP methyl ester carboxylesterase/DNA-binding CsgD family transcriptional regulator